MAINIVDVYTKCKIFSVNWYIITKLFNWFLSVIEEREKKNHIQGKWGTAQWNGESVLTRDGVMILALTWEEIADCLNELELLREKIEAADKVIDTILHTPVLTDTAKSMMRTNAKEALEHYKALKV